jgi:hypothetical protein
MCKSGSEWKLWLTYLSMLINTYSTLFWLVAISPIRRDGSFQNITILQIITVLSLERHMHQYLYTCNIHSMDQ